MTTDQAKSDQRSSADTLLDQTEESSLFVCSIHEDQRPLKGVAGALDWRLRGFLSRFVISGRISGQMSEFVYIPIKHHGVMRHLMIVGLGSQEEPNGPAHSTLLGHLAERVAQLNFKHVAISRSSFPFLDESKVKKALKGVDVEFTQ